MPERIMAESIQAFNLAIDKDGPHATKGVLSAYRGLDSLEVIAVGGEDRRDFVAALRMGREACAMAGTPQTQLLGYSMSADLAFQLARGPEAERAMARDLFLELMKDIQPGIQATSFKGMQTALGPALLRYSAAAALIHLDFKMAGDSRKSIRSKNALARQRLRAQLGGIGDDIRKLAHLPERHPRHGRPSLAPVLMTMTQFAFEQLRVLTSNPKEPRLIRFGLPREWPFADAMSLAQLCLVRFGQDTAHAQVTELRKPFQQHDPKVRVVKPSRCADTFGEMGLKHYWYLASYPYHNPFLALAQALKEVASVRSVNAAKVIQETIIARFFAESQPGEPILLPRI